MEIITKKIIDYFASSLNDDTCFKKKIDYLYLLPLMSNLEYGRSYVYAEKRGIALSKRFGDFYREVLENIKSILNADNATAGKIATDIFKKASLEELEAVLLANRNENFLDEFVVLKGRENIEKCLNNGKGTILTLLHAGSFASLLSKTAKDYDKLIMNGITWDYRLSPCNITKKFIKGKIDGMTFFWKGEFFQVGRLNPRRIYSALSDNEFLVILIDAPLGKTPFINIKFLNKTVKFPYSAMKIAHKTSAKVLPLSVYRENNKIVGEYFEPFNVETDNYGEVLQKLFFLLEKNIFKYPSEFFYWTSPTSWRTIDKL